MSSQRISQHFAWFMCLVAAVFYSYEYILRVIPSILVPSLMQTLQIGPSQIGVIASLYYLTYTPLQLFVGTIMDHYGVRWPLTIATTSCALGIYIFSIPILIYAKLGMLLVGFGSAFAFVGALKLTSMWLRHDRFAYYSGLVNMLGFLGACVGTISMQALVEQMG